MDSSKNWGEFPFLKSVLNWKIAKNSFLLELWIDCIHYNEAFTHNEDLSKKLKFCSFTQKEDLIEWKKIICLKGFCSLKKKDLFEFNNICSIQENIFRQNKYLF